jgi:hypothetical protein
VDELPSKERAQEIRKRLDAPIPSTESQGYRVMREFSVELLALLDACKGVLLVYTCETYYDAHEQIQANEKARDLTERIGGNDGQKD